MTTTMSQQEYSLQRSALEYDRLRAQARTWESAAETVLDRVRPRPGGSALDAGCGPGETMRLLARRVGPHGTVTGIDVDAALGAVAERSLHAEGYPQVRFVAADLSVDEPVPGGPYDVVYARLLLFHLPQRVAVLARLWDAVAPGGALVVQEYDLGAIDLVPPLPSVEEVRRVICETFLALGCDIRAGFHLSQLFGEAGIGAPDGTDVAGRIEPLATGQRILSATFSSVLPAALAHGVTGEAEADATLAALARDADRLPDASLFWPLMLSAWKRKEVSAGGPSPR
ncbi:methyltransferase domain-containing protein [Petropleomorpha daqingensis]|uniref:SAM-dependent methyltransferase n=1 Tax=Petropleomorpha daqingensis TaxID=2026353 RepID=A0A853CEY6_9ACTN|nr:methyltransferase domain-containing protein [Petropleomorpha daqingensis]NYJ06410.1 SAM-dependent methyltransferase [Petropleomorpha daqingensis]